MNKKLTLKLDSEVISRAKTYAREQNISLSKLTESYFDLLTKENSEEENDLISPFIKNISSGNQLDPDLDYREEYRSIRDKKYS